MSTLDEETTRELVEKALTSSGPARNRAEQKLMEYLYRSGVLGVWANSLANRHGDVGNRHREDLVGVISVALIRWLQDLDRSRLEDVKSWPAFMFRIAAFGVRDYLDSGKVTVASKMSAFARRTRYIGYAQEKLREELKREPSRDEVIEYVNAEATRRLKDPRRQGALIDYSDFGDIARPAADFSELNVSSDSADSNLAERMEVAGVMAVVMSECASRQPGNAQVQRVIAEWVDITQSGDEPSPTVIARSLGLSITTVVGALETLNSVLDDIRQGSVAVPR